MPGPANSTTLAPEGSARHRRSAAAVGLLAALAAALIWGGGSVVSRYLVSHRFDPVDLGLLRYLGCFPIALAMWAVQRDRVSLAISWRRLALLLLLAGPPYHVLVIASYRYATAGEGAIFITGLMQTCSLVLPYVLAGMRPLPSALGGTALAVGGLLAFAIGDDAQLLIMPAGLLMFVIAALGWALLSYLVRLWAIDPLRLTNTLAMWSPLFLPVYGLSRPSSVLSGPINEALLQLLYHGVLVAYGATLLFFIAVRRIGIAVASVSQALAPCIAMLFGALLLGEWPTPARLAGAAAVVAGVVIASIGALARPQ